VLVGVLSLSRVGAAVLKFDAGRSLRFVNVRRRPFLRHSRPVPSLACIFVRVRPLTWLQIGYTGRTACHPSGCHPLGWRLAFTAVCVETCAKRARRTIAGDRGPSRPEGHGIATLARSVGQRLPATPSKYRCRRSFGVLVASRKTVSAIGGSTAPGRSQITRSDACVKYAICG
jgi:hypothetical protein